MIKFFRHIRKTLLEQKQMGKYFKYAIGEILLVVIGILIALQINNWNEERKSYNKERQLYQKLLSDVQFNQKAIEVGILRLKEHEDLYHHLYKESRKKASYNPKLHYGKIRWGFSLNLKLRNLYQNQMNGISNREISDAFMKYMMAEESTQDFSLVFNDFKKDIVRPFITKKNLINTDSIYAQPKYQEVDTKNSINYNAMKKLFDTQEFDQLLYELKVKTASFFGWLNTLKEVNEELETTLKKSLNTL